MKTPYFSHLLDNSIRLEKQNLSSDSIINKAKNNFKLALFLNWTTYLFKIYIKINKIIHWNIQKNKVHVIILFYTIQLLLLFYT